MSSSPRQVPAAGPSVKLFEYPQSGQMWSSSAPSNVHSDGRDANGGSQDLQRLLTEARAQGIQEGLQQAQQNSAKSEVQEVTLMTEAIRNFQQQASDYYGRVEVELVHLALAIAAKILHREAQVDRMLVGALAKVALEKLQQGTKVSVHANPEEVAGWKEYLRSNFSGWVNIEVESDGTVKPHSCVVHTELGETEIGIESQLKEIERGFFDLLAQRPGSK